MDITIVDTTITTAPTGGAQTFLVDLCRGLRKLGWRVSVVTKPGGHRSVVDTLSSFAIPVLEDIWKGHHLPEERGERLAAWTRQKGTNVYVISISLDAGWLALPLLSSGIATVSIAHADNNAFYAPLRHYGPLIDCAVGVSKEVTRKIVDDGGVPTARVRGIPYGVPTLSEELLERRLESDETAAKLKVGYVGRLEQSQKRLLDLVPLASILKERGVPVSIHLVGDGSLRDHLKSELCRAGVSDLVRFWGWLPTHEVMERLSELDVFVLFSDSEGLPVALLEAGAQAVVPVVTRTASGNAEIVQDGVNGFLLPIGDCEGFADRIETLAKDRSCLYKMRRAIWETCRQYTIERMVEEYAFCFEHLTEDQVSRNQAGRPVPYPLMPSCRSVYPRWLRKIKWGLKALAS